MRRPKSARVRRISRAGQTGQTGKLSGFFSLHKVKVELVKSPITKEKRYVPWVGEKQLLLSWKTRLYAETYGNAVASRCKRMAELFNEKLRTTEQEKQHG